MADTGVTPNGGDRLRERLKAGDYVLGLTVTTNNLETAALAAKMGFHFLWIEMEHSPVSLESLRQIVIGTAGLDTAVIARVPVAELWTAKRVLDQGVRGVIFPFVGDAQTARIAAAACRYPPSGRRGSGAGRAESTWFEPGSYYDSADAHVLTVAIIEETRALDEIEAIAATPGIDVLFIGVSDLAFSLGLRGEQNGPQHREAIEKIVAAARRHHKILGRPAATAEDVLRYHKQGFQFFQSVAEIGLMRLGARQILEPLGLATRAARQGSLY